MKVAFQCYPDLLEKCIIINETGLFKKSWSIFKTNFHKQTQQKIILAGSEFKNLLRDMIPENHIHKCLGGTSEVPLEDNPGPWAIHLTKAKTQKTMDLPNRKQFYEYFLTFKEKEQWLANRLYV